MKILIFEYITGGGFCDRDLPSSLAREGYLMLNALLNDFAKLPSHHIEVMLDARCISAIACKNINRLIVNSTDNIFTVFENALQNCDAAWIIAPETNNMLFNFSQRVEKAKKLLLSAPSSAIAQCADKLQTFNILNAHHILTIPTQRLSDLPGFKHQEGLAQVIKPINGVGCENNFLIQNQIELEKIYQQINEPQNYIIQPFIQGDALSICALFNQGQAQLICVNRQHLAIHNQQFHLIACEVNIAIDTSDFKIVLNKIAKAFPDLFGYIGIDLILADQLYVVEINPRLTSSYSGIQQALGINVADLVLQSLNKMPQIHSIFNQTTFIEIAQE